MLEETSKKLGVWHAVYHTRFPNDSADLGVAMAPGGQLDTSRVRIGPVPGTEQVLSEAE